MCGERLLDVGFDALEWEDVARGQRPGGSAENRDPTEPRFGWQCLASVDVERTCLHGAMWPELSPTDRALLRSQWSICWHLFHLLTSCDRVASGTSDLQGSIASSPCAPFLSLLTLAGAAVLLTIVATIGLMGGQGCWGVEGSLCRAQQPASATTGRLRLWLMVCRSSTERNWQPMQLWCLLRGDGSARRQCADHGAVLQQARRMCPELARPRGRARLVVLGCEIGGRWSDEARDFVSQLAKSEVPQGTPQLRRSVRHAWYRRWSTLLACSPGPSASRFWSIAEVLAWMGRPHRPQLCLRSSDKSVRTSELATCAGPVRTFLLSC